MLRIKIQYKYELKCTGCGHVTSDFWTWFEQGQQCPKCGSKHSEVWYNRNYNKLKRIWNTTPESIWKYFTFLPLLRKRHIISFNEGSVPLERWDFLENYAKEKYNLEIEVHVYRNDLNGGTGTFKDIAASLAASLFKEIGIKQYCIASTGNSATAYAKYLSKAGVNCSVFMPEDAIKSSEATISSFGQQVFRVMGDYAKAKEIAAGYAKIHNIPMSTGNIDPIRIEAKKTMVFEWLRQIGKLPDVYIQAVSGGRWWLPIRGVPLLVARTLPVPAVALGLALFVLPLVGLVQRAEWSGLLDRLRSPAATSAMRLSATFSGCSNWFKFAST